MTDVSAHEPAHLDPRAPGDGASAGTWAHRARVPGGAGNGHPSPASAPSVDAGRPAQHAEIYNAGGFFSSEILAGTSAQVARVTGSSGPSNALDSFRITIPQYTNASKRRSFHLQGTHDRADSTGNKMAMTGAGWWRNTANAINRMTMSLSTGNLISGSTGILNGIN